VPLIVYSIWLAACAGCGAADPADGPLPAKFERLAPLHTRLGTPQPGDWLAVHPERGQSYEEYVRGRPVKPNRKRRIIYVRPLGDFDPAQRKIVEQTAQLLGIYFDLPVTVQESLPLSLIPAKARRTRLGYDDPQLLTTYVLHDVLRPRLPDDAAVSIAFTTSDLWPGGNWNFVFGQASLRDRVGVWSIYRNGNPSASEEAFRLCLLRTIKTATHETGHMFSMMHCTLYECNMCGSNHRAESDRRPLALCPHCLAKLSHATGADLETRFEKLIAFCRATGLEEQQQFYEKSLAALRAQ
jgi:archaemetzincin